MEGHRVNPVSRTDMISPASALSLMYICRAWSSLSFPHFILQYRQSPFCIPSMTSLTHLGQLYPCGAKSPWIESWWFAHCGGLATTCCQPEFVCLSQCPPQCHCLGPSQKWTAEFDHQLVIQTDWEQPTNSKTFELKQIYVRMRSIQLNN